MGLPAMAASAPSSASGGGRIWRLNSATPYLLGSIVLVMVLIAVALLMLLCSLRKDRRRSAADKSSKGEEVTGASVPMPGFVVIMAGDDRPTYLAMPAIPSPPIYDAGGDRSGADFAGPLVDRTLIA